MGRILVVDDDIPMLEVLTEIIEVGGYEYDAFSDPITALAAFSATPDAYDLVISDQTMPTISGTKLVSEIRQLRLDVPVILLTGYSGIAYENDRVEYGVDRWLRKPVRIRELLSVIADLLGGARSSARA